MGAERHGGSSTIWPPTTYWLSPADDGQVWRRRYGMALALSGWAMRTTTRLHVLADRLDLWLANRAWKPPRR